VQRHTEKVVISAGINNRERAPTSPTFRALYKAMDRIFPEARFFYMEININSEQGHKQKATIELINYRLHQARFRRIPRIPEGTFTTTRDLVHWTQHTAEQILKQIIQHI
jgi:hypothetical protein